MELEKLLPDKKYVAHFKQMHYNYKAYVNLDLVILGAHDLNSLQQYLLSQGIPIDKISSSSPLEKKEGWANYKGLFYSGLHFHVYSSVSEEGNTRVSLRAKHKVDPAYNKIDITGFNSLMTAIRDYVKFCEQEPLTTLDSRVK